MAPMPASRAADVSRRELVWGIAVFVAGAAATAGVISVYGKALGSWVALTAFIVLETMNAFASVWLAKRFRIAIWHLDGAILAAGVCLLEPSGVVVTMALGTLIGHVLARRPVSRLLATVGQVAIAVSGAVFAFELFRGDASIASARAGLAILVAVLVMTVLWEVVVGLLFWGIDREPFLPGLAPALRFALVRAPFAASLGYVAGLASTVSDLAPLFAVPPMAAMVVVLAEHFRAERDRERAETLFRTAQAAHASIEPADVTDALVEAASTLLATELAEVRSAPPGAGEVGVRLDTAAELWLVVPEAAGEHDEDQMLAAVAAVGSSALENARLAEELAHQAVHDTLTGLPNKVLFADRVTQAVSAHERSRSQFAVVALDLDAFRKVNDSLGHAVGDELLQVVGSRLTEAVKPGDTIARLSSDVFVLLLQDVGSAESAGVVTEKLLAAVGRPIPLRGQDVFMTACAGLAFFPTDGMEAGHLLRNADSALHRAKNHGPGSYEIYAQGMNELAHQRLARESELHQAVRRDELRVRYQPQIDMRTGRIVGVEALVRWEHPILGTLGPNEFVPLAEESGLIVDVDTWVLTQAAKQCSSWLAEGLAPVRVAVNISARHFQSPERLIGTVRDVLAESGMPPALLELEVTEGLAIHEDRSAEVLQRLRDMWVSISIVDFGTGYSMLARLHRFPVDRL
jgi:diguanylate cyclase (GGDEF)-like protein